MRVLQQLLLVGIGVIFICVSIYSSQQQSLTYDEIVHIQDGYYSLINQNFSLDPYNPPLLKTSAVFPLLILYLFFPDISTNNQLLLIRSFTILLGLLLLYLVYRRANKISYSVGLFALFLLAFEPTFLSYSHLIGLDTGTALFIFISYMSFIELGSSFSFAKLTLVGTYVGLAFSSRISTIPILSLLFTAVTVCLFSKKKLIKVDIKIFIFAVFWVISIIFMVIWASYFFTLEPVLVKTSDQNRKSAQIVAWAEKSRLAQIVKVISFFQENPIPLGKYVAIVKNNVLRSSHADKTFFMGQMYDSAKWYMLPINFLYKTPIPLQILFCIGAAVMVKKRMKKELIIFLMPIGVIFVFNSIAGVQPLVRYTLPVIPFVAVVAGVSALWATNIWKKLFIGLIFAWYITDFFHAFPNFISYVNQYSGSANKQYLLFTDSNIDWGQSLPMLMQFIQSEKPHLVNFSYFGRDDASLYGFLSNKLYGSWTAEDICQMHEIQYPEYSEATITVISVTNWHSCGYSKQANFSKEKVHAVIAGSFLIF